MSLIGRFLTLAAVVFSAWAAGATSLADSSYVQIRLPRGVSVELPKNWTTISDNQRVTLSAFVQAKREQLSESATSSELGFAANYYDDAGKTAGIFNIRYYPEVRLTQQDAENVKPSDMKELDDALRENVTPGVEAVGNRLLEWRGTRKVNINGVVAFVSQYRRTSPQGVPFTAQLIRVFNGSRSFTVTLSYREDQKHFLAAICERVIRSIRA